MRSALVVGADGLIGRALATRLASLGVKVVPSSRRALPTGGVHLDLSKRLDLDVIPKVDVAFLCAAISRFADCEKDPTLARQVNVLAQVAIAEKLFELGTHVVFISSNSVFDGRESAPNEEAMPSPESLYGELKHEAEGLIQNIADRQAGRFSIVRLTKVLDARVSLLDGWRKRLADGLTIEAFKDVTVSPVSLAYAVDGLAKVGQTALDGVFHLSGARECTYFQFATEFAMACGADTDLVRPVFRSIQTGLPMLHNHLGMTSTLARLGVSAQPANVMLSDLVSPSGYPSDSGV
jgi:dTDP-4-dehydrorhamnose reductase